MGHLLTTVIKTDNGEDVRHENDSGTTLKLILRLTLLFLIVTSFILLGALVFVAIESKNEKTKNTLLLAQQEKFNKTWHGNRTFGDFERNYTRYLKIANLTCEIAKLDMYGWNTMNTNHALKYSYSVISTTGWGVFDHPGKSTLNKVICMIYATFGIPLLYTLIVHIIKMIMVYETKLRISALSRRWFDGYTSPSLMIIKFGTVVVVVMIQSYLTTVVLKYRTNKADVQEMYTKLDVSRDWSLTEGVYWIVINGITLVGLGDQYLLGTTKFEVAPIVSMTFNMFVLMLTLASLERVFMGVREFVDQSIGRKLGEEISNLVESVGNLIESLENLIIENTERNEIEHDEG